MKEINKQTETAFDPFYVPMVILSNGSSVVFDVGEFVGQVTTRHRQLFPSASIHFLDVVGAALAANDHK